MGSVLGEPSSIESPQIGDFLFFWGHRPSAPRRAHREPKEDDCTTALDLGHDDPAQEPIAAGRCVARPAALRRGVAVLGGGRCGSWMADRWRRGRYPAGETRGSEIGPRYVLFCGRGMAGQPAELSPGHARFRRKRKSVDDCLLSSSFLDGGGHITSLLPGPLSHPSPQVFALSRYVHRPRPPRPPPRYPLPAR